MANCDICGKKIGIFSGGSLSASVNSTVCSIAFCDSCAQLIEAVKAGDNEAYQKAISSDHILNNPKTRAFLDCIYAENAGEQIIEVDLAAQIEKLRASGADGYYEYKVVKLEDFIAAGRLGTDLTTNAAAGCLDTDLMMNTLNRMGLEGWRLATAYTNELFQNAHALGGFGSNATADEHILIFERYHKI